MSHKLCRVLTLCLALAAPSFTAAQAPFALAPETLASFPLPSLPDRPFALQFAGAVALFSLPDWPIRKAFPAVLILPDALGADGRAVPYVESLLGAGIAVLELRDASAEAARAALALLASDPRIEAPRLGVLGFGQGARLALGLPGADVRTLLYPGCASLPVPQAAPGGSSTAAWRGRSRQPRTGLRQPLPRHSEAGRTGSPARLCRLAGCGSYGSRRLQPSRNWPS
jgi:hypothetical protein